ncbi:MAG TPA: Ig-like domain-containing protein [Saprospiraceae bacterium]|nr:Ig-like domain-containing protein [Saprospiraceae bacterium]
MRIVRKHKYFIHAFVFLLFPAFLLAQQSAAKSKAPELLLALGTGQSSGHIATLYIKNEAPESVRLQPATYYIPALRGFQSYVGSLDDVTTIGPDTVQSIPLYGYCTDVHRAPAPGGMAMSIADWILVSAASDSALTTLQPGPRVKPFSGVDREALSFSGTPKTNTEAPAICWPDNHQQIGVMINPDADAKSSAALIVMMVQQIEAQVPIMQSNSSLVTPYHGMPEAERLGVTQHAIWLSIGALTGKAYTLEDFTKSMNKLWREQAGDLPADEKMAGDQALEKTLPVIWQQFVTVAQAAGVIMPDPAAVNPSLDVKTTVVSPWNHLDLTSSSMKPHKLEPWIIWGPAGAAVLGGATAAILLSRDSSTTPKPTPKLVVRNDAVTMACDGEANVSPLVNDEGEGLFIKSVTPVNFATIQLDATGSSLQISNLGQAADFTISILIEDKYGQQATGTIAVTVQKPDIQAVNDTYSTPFGTPVNGQVLDNDQGENLSVLSYEQPAGGVLTIQPNGSMNFVPSPGFSGTTSANYTILGACGIQDEGKVSFEVDEPTCDTKAEFELSGASCGGFDGSAKVDITPEGDYTYQWSNGSTGSSVDEVKAGSYTVTVTDDNGCAQAFSVSIPENEAAYIREYDVNPANCLGSGGDIFLYIDGPDSSPLAIVATGPDGEHGIVRQPGPIHLGDQINILPGNWHIRVNGLEQAAHCVVELELEVEDTSSPIATVRDVITVFTGSTYQGNVLRNDQGLALKVVDFSQPEAGVLLLQTDGSFSYSAPADRTGEFLFTYQVIDACGQASQQESVIQVISDPCDFEVEFDVQATICGMALGAIQTSVYPEGDYSFYWSNGSTATALSELPRGKYELVVNPLGKDCPRSFMVVVPDSSFTFITDTITFPGTCQDGGNIRFTLESPSDAPVLLQISGPMGASLISLNPGTYNLDAIFPVPSGIYTFTAYQSASPTDCAQTLEIRVPDATPVMQLTPDTLATPFRTPVSGNVLDNDTGSGLKVISAFNIEGGTLRIEMSGGFTYNPHGNFSGQGQFMYIVQDACGRKDTGLVTIQVYSGTCSLTPEFEILPATCGSANGSIHIVIANEGSYTFAWSNGDTSNTASNLTAGNYQVAITSNVLGCMQSFERSVPSAPAHFIDDMDVVQPDCPETGDILLALTSTDTQLLRLDVKLGNTINSFLVPVDTVRLSDYMTVLPGKYTLRVRYAEGDSSCVDTTTAELIPSVGLAIATTAIIPASGPMSSDGSMTIAVTSKGVLPYQIFINDSYYGSIPFEMFSIFNLGAGKYRVRIRDATGCISNLLEVEIPVAPFALEGTFGLSVSEVSAAGKEQNNVPLPVFTAISGIWNQNFAGTSAQLIAQIQPFASHRANFWTSVGGVLSLSQSLRLAHSHWGPVSSQLSIGAGSSMVLDNETNPWASIQPYLHLQAQSQYQLKGRLIFRLQAQVLAWPGYWHPVIQGGVVIPIRLKSIYNRFK